MTWNEQAKTAQKSEAFKHGIFCISRKAYCGHIGLTRCTRSEKPLDKHPSKSRNSFARRILGRHLVRNLLMLYKPSSLRNHGNKQSRSSSMASF